MQAGCTQGRCRQGLQAGEERQACRQHRCRWVRCRQGCRQERCGQAAGRVQVRVQAGSRQEELQAGQAQARGAGRVQGGEAQQACRQQSQPQADAGRSAGSSSALHLHKLPKTFPSTRGFPVSPSPSVTGGGDDTDMTPRLCRSHPLPNSTRRGGGGRKPSSTRKGQIWSKKADLEKKGFFLSVAPRQAELLAALLAPNPPLPPSGR